MALQRILAYVAEEAANEVSGDLLMAGMLRREAGEGQRLAERAEITPTCRSGAAVRSLPGGQDYWRSKPWRDMPATMRPMPGQPESHWDAWDLGRFVAR